MKTVEIIERLEKTFFHRISMSEVKEALKKMKTRKTLGLDGILIEI